MPMTRDEHIKFLTDQIALTLDAASHQLRKGPVGFAISTNLLSAFSALLQKGLMQWRHGLDSPVPAFRAALDVAREAAAAVPAALAEAAQKQAQDQRKGFPVGRQPKPYMFFDFSAASIVSFLLDGKPDPSLMSGRPDPREWSPAQRDWWDRFLDCGLLDQMMYAKLPENWQQILDFGRKRKRLALAVTTYETYAALVQTLRSGDTESASSLVRTSKQLYEQRSHDEYFHGSIEYDGPDGGEDSVDFRLSAILRVGPGSELPNVAEIERWRW